MAAFIVAALVLPQSFRLTVFTDVIETVLLLSGLASFIPLVLRSRGRMRVFWSLIVLGLVLWFTYQLFWVYYELVLRRDVPDLFNGDVILFLNLVPPMAALALRPMSAATNTPPAWGVLILRCCWCGGFISTC